METRFHGLEQKRMYCLNVDEAIFTNLTQDHLDFHVDFEHYFLSKKKLFNVENGNFPETPIINIDEGYGAQLYGKLCSKNIYIISFGSCDDADFRICNITSKIIFLARNFRYKQMRISSTFLLTYLECTTYTT